jgi:hypothetical protein
MSVKGSPFEGGQVKVSFHVKNTGKRDGEEVSQIYVTALDFPGEPIKALKWFKRHEVKAGKKVKLTGELGREAFEIFDDKNWVDFDKNETLVLREGRFRIWVGGSSAESELITKDFQVKKVGFAVWKIGVICGAGVILIAAVLVGVIMMRRPETVNQGLAYESLN